MTILPVIKRLGVPLIAMTGNPQSTLGKAAAAVLDVSVAEEACPLNLAPTASTTATLAMGDALAVAVLEARGFSERGFRALASGRQPGPPAAAARRRRDAHRRADADGERRTRSLRDGLLEISRKGLGMTAIVDAERRVLGIYTDGDLRRALDQPIDLSDPAHARA